MSRPGETVSLRITLRYRSVDEFVDRYAENVSSAGLFIRTKAPKPAGTKIRFELLLSDGSRALRGEGVVVGARHDERAGMSLRFHSLEPSSEQLVERIVETHGQGPLAPTPLASAFAKRTPRSPSTLGAGGIGGWTPLGSARTTARTPLPRTPLTRSQTSVRPLPRGSSSAALPPPDRSPTEVRAPIPSDLSATEDALDPVPSPTAEGPITVEAEAPPMAEPPLEASDATSKPDASESELPAFEAGDEHTAELPAGEALDAAPEGEAELLESNTPEADAAPEARPQEPGATVAAPEADAAAEALLEEDAAAPAGEAGAAGETIEPTESQPPMVSVPISEALSVEPTEVGGLEDAERAESAGDRAVPGEAYGADGQDAEAGSLALPPFGLEVEARPDSPMDDGATVASPRSPLLEEEETRAIAWTPPEASESEDSEFEAALSAIGAALDLDIEATARIDTDRALEALGNADTLPSFASPVAPPRPTIELPPEHEAAGTGTEDTYPPKVHDDPAELEAEAWKIPTASASEEDEAEGWVARSELPVESETAPEDDEFESPGLESIAPADRIATLEDAPEPASPAAMPAVETIPSDSSVASLDDDVEPANPAAFVDTIPPVDRIATLEHDAEPENPAAFVDTIPPADRIATLEDAPEPASPAATPAVETVSPDGRIEDDEEPASPTALPAFGDGAWPLAEHVFTLPEAPASLAEDSSPDLHELEEEASLPEPEPERGDEDEDASPGSLFDPPARRPSGISDGSPFDRPSRPPQPLESVFDRMPELPKLPEPPEPSEHEAVDPLATTLELTRPVAIASEDVEVGEVVVEDPTVDGDLRAPTWVAPDPEVSEVAAESPLENGRPTAHSIAADEAIAAFAEEEATLLGLSELPRSPDARPSASEEVITVEEPAPSFAASVLPEVDDLEPPAADPVVSTDDPTPASDPSTMITASDDALSGRVVPAELVDFDDAAQSLQVVSRAYEDSSTEVVRARKPMDDFEEATEIPAGRARPSGPRKPVALDLGLHYVRLGYLESGRLELVPLRGSPYLPAWIAARPDGQLVVGARARAIGRDAPDRSLPVLALLRGLSEDNPSPPLKRENDQVRVRLGDRDHDPSDLLVTFLRTVRAAYLEHLGHDHVRLMVSNPADLGDASAAALRSACREAEIEAFRLEPEPRALLEAYHLNDQLLDAVVTLDVGLSRSSLGIFVRTDGALRLTTHATSDAVGAGTLDRRVAEVALDAFFEATGEDHRGDPQALEHTVSAVERVRGELKRAPHIDLRVNLSAPGGAGGVAPERIIRVPRARIQDETEDLVAKICRFVRSELESVGVEAHAVGAIVLAGSGGDFPPLVEALGHLFGREPLTSVPPATALLLGLARSGAMAERKPNSATHEGTLTASIGLELPGGRFLALVHAGTRLPIKLSRRVPPTRSTAEVKLFQGEGEVVRLCSPLGKVELEGGNRNDAVELQLEVERDGVMKARLHNARTNKSSQLLAATQQTSPERRRLLADRSPPAKPTSGGGFFRRLFGG